MYKEKFSSTVRLEFNMFSIISRIFVLLLLTLVKWACTESLDYRLPEDIIPTSYELKIMPNLKDTFDFSGEVTINVRATANTRQVILHCHELNVTRISISNETEKINHDPPDYIVDKQFLKLTTASELLKNCEYSIHAFFRGSLRDEPVGFYKERYKCGNGSIRLLATTQLEPIYARTVFPCFDEPHFKTPFSIHIARSEDQMSVANMPYIMSKGPEIKIQNRTWDMFESKQSISTYQVAFTVTEYFFKPDVGNVVLLGTPNRSNKNIFEVLTKSETILKELESYTNMSFTKENMHMVALSDFVVGALDSDRLLAIKELLLVHSQSKTSKLSKEVTELAAVHEFAHQWFGDYVTPLWWNCTWLKEAFATFMEYKILNKIEPKWKVEEIFITDILQQALLQDRNTHPMTAEVQTPSEIVNLYDSVTYQKGASILKMLEFMVTPSTFKKGTQKYLKAGSNKSTVTPDDLWDAINKQALEDKISLPTSVKELMKPWTEQSGYPLITVSVENRDVTIKQEPYAKYSSNATWIIPITYGIQGEDLSATKPMEWLSPYEQLVLDNAVEERQWIIVNLGQTGYYRVNYDYDNWNALTNQLMKDYRAIDPVLRAKLIDDALNLAIDEKLNYNTALSLLRYFPLEKHYLPQISVLYNLKNLFLKFEQTSIEKPLKLFISELIMKLYKYLGPSNGFFENYITYRIRKDLVYLACKVGIEHCRESLSSLYKKHRKHLEKIDENLKPAVFCTALETSSEREDSVFDNLLKFYNKTNSALDREIVINSFACLNDDNKIKEILSRNITILRSRDLQKANEVVLQSGKRPSAVPEYIRVVLARINGNIIPANIEANLKYIIRNMKIVNIEQLRALNALLHEVKELERFHSILNELVDRSQNATVYIRETERAAREVNETLNEFFAPQNESKKYDCFFHPVEYFKNKLKDSPKFESGIVKMINLKNNVGHYFGEKIKNISKYIYDVLHLMNKLPTVPLPEPSATEVSTSTVTDPNFKSDISGSRNETQ